MSEYLFPPEVIADPERFKPEPVVELWDLISKQDWDVCERAQTGVGSRWFTTGVYPRQDGSCTRSTRTTGCGWGASRSARRSGRGWIAPARRVAFGEDPDRLAADAREPLHLRRTDVERGLGVERARLVYHREHVVGHDHHRAAA